MINKQASIDALKGMEGHELINIIDTDYYRTMMHCQAEEMNGAIDRLITELVDVQEGCAIAERYDLAILCRQKLAELADNIDVKQMLY